jgi:hypothetical protein
MPEPQPLTTASPGKSATAAPAHSDPGAPRTGCGSWGAGIVHTLSGEIANVAVCALRTPDCCDFGRKRPWRAQVCPALQVCGTSGAPRLCGRRGCGCYPALTCLPASALPLFRRWGPRKLQSRFASLGSRSLGFLSCRRGPPGPAWPRPPFRAPAGPGSASTPEWAGDCFRPRPRFPPQGTQRVARRPGVFRQSESRSAEPRFGSCASRSLARAGKETPLDPMRLDPNRRTFVRREQSGAPLYLACTPRDRSARRRPPSGLPGQTGSREAREELETRGERAGREPARLTWPLRPFPGLPASLDSQHEAAPHPPRAYPNRLATLVPKVLLTISLQLPRPQGSMVSPKPGPQPHPGNSNPLPCPACSAPCPGVVPSLLGVCPGLQGPRGPDRRPRLGFPPAVPCSGPGLRSVA